MLHDAMQPRVLIVSSCPGGPTPGVEAGGLPAGNALRDLLIDLFKGYAARGHAAPFGVDPCATMREYIRAKRPVLNRPAPDQASEH